MARAGWWLTLVLLGTSPAHAQDAIPEVEPERDGLLPRLSLIAEARSALGSGEQRGLFFQLYGAGVELQLSPVLHTRLLLVGIRFDGVGAQGEPTPAGLGGEGGFYVTPWPRSALRPHLFASAAILGFPTAPFLPGGSRYDFMTRGGLGLDLSVTPHLTLGLDLFGTHISNGQGIGPHNPSLDGYGGGLHITYAPLTRTVPPDPWDVDEPETTYVPGAAVDGSVGTIDGELIGSARARLFPRLYEGLMLAIDGEAGSLADEPYGEVGAAVVTHVGPVTLGAHGGYRRFVGFDSAIGVAQLEGHLQPALSLVGTVHVEHGELGGGFWRSVGAARVYPFRSLMLAGGVGIGPLGREGEDAEFVPYAAAEWAPPLPLGDWQLALFAESQASGIRQVGLRVGRGLGEGPRDLSARQGWRRLR